MRYTTDHKEETHRHIVKVASQRFRKEGIEKVSIASLMEHAGLTVGGFYSHFKSKEALIQEAVGMAADETFCRIFVEADDKTAVGLQLMLQRYLSPEHRDNPERGCVIASLASELKNRPEKTREMIAGKALNTIQRISDCFSQQVNIKTRIEVAGSIWAVMVGTLQHARIVTDKELSTRILQEGITNALRLAAEIEKLHLE